MSSTADDFLKFKSEMESKGELPSDTEELTPGAQDLLNFRSNSLQQGVKAEEAVTSEPNVEPTLQKAPLGYTGGVYGEIGGMISEKANKAYDELRERLLSSGASPSEVEKKITKRKLLDLGSLGAATGASLMSGGIGPALAVGAVAGFHDVLKDVIEEAAIDPGSAIGEAAKASLVEGVFRPVSIGKQVAKLPGVKQGVGKLKDTAMYGKKLEQADALLGKIGDKASSIKRSISTTLNSLDKKIQEATEKSFKTKTVLARNTADSISILEKDLDKGALKLISLLGEELNKAKKVLQSKYDNVLNGEAGKTPLNINDEVNVISGLLGVNAANPKTRLTKVLKSLDEVLPRTSSLDPVNISLKDVHWLKQLFRGKASALLKPPENQRLAFEIFDLVKALDDKIETALPGEYKSLNKIYSKFYDTEEKLNSAFKLVDEKRGVRSVEGIKDTVYATLKEGKALTDDIIKTQNKRVMALNDTVDFYREAGFEAQAQNIENNIQRIVDKSKSKLDYEKILKDAQIKDKELLTELKLRKSKVELKKRESLLNLEKRANQIQQLFPENVAYLQTADIIDDALKAGAVAAAGPKITPFLNSIKTARVIHSLGPKWANKASLLLDKVEKDIVSKGAAISEKVRPVLQTILANERSKNE